MKSDICRTLIAAFALAVAGCESTRETPAPFVRAETIEASAVVADIYKSARLLLLRAPAGDFSVVAGPDVKNFDQIRVGDKVEVAYVVGLAAELNKSKGAAPSDLQSSSNSYVAPVGGQPGAGASQTVQVTVAIEAVDTKLHTVTFKRADGFVRVVSVETDEGKKFISSLRKGDLVDVTYTEAIAIAVTPGK